MALDANIILQSNQQRQDPLATVTNALNLKQSIENQNFQRSERERAGAIRGSTVIGPDGKIDRTATMNNLRGYINPDEATGLQHKWTTEDLAVQKAEHEGKKAQLERAEKNLSMVGNALSSLGGNPALADLYRTAQAMRQQGMEIDLSQLPDDQALVPGFMQQMQRQAMGVAKTLEQYRADWEAQAKALQPPSGSVGASLKAQSNYDATGGTFMPPGSPSGGGMVPGMTSPSGLTPGDITIAPPGNALAGGEPPVAIPPVDIHSRRMFEMEQANAAYGDPDKIAQWTPEGKIQIKDAVVSAKAKVAQAGRPIQNNFERKKDQQQAEALVKAQSNAEDAWSIHGKIKYIADTLEGYGGGPVDGYTQKMTQFLPGYEKLTTAVQLANSVRSTLAPKLREAGSGATSDFEMGLWMDSLPSLMTTPEGRRLMAKYAEQVAKRLEWAADYKADILESGQPFRIKDMREAMAKQFGRDGKDSFFDSIQDKEYIENASKLKGAPIGRKGTVSAAPPKTIRFEDLKE